jgi:serine phosphatase RsbU (regulator of sigma subunit)
MGAKYETAKKEKENEILRQKDQINSLESSRKDSEITRQRIAIGGVGAALLLMIVLAFFIFKGYRQKQRDNRIIEQQKQLVEEKNKDITDSIQYAQRIQEALLPPREIKYRIFPDAFVLFEPRDIVSGDFYWFAEKDGKRLIAAVDCTGHGVPGAFMSLIGNTFLNELVVGKGITEPAAVLNGLREMVTGSLRQSGSGVQAQDGMDIALLCFDDAAQKISFAGANNPLWVVGRREGGVVLEEYSANKRPIGYYPGETLPFEGHLIAMRPGDCIYIFTDGFADQFGGEAGKKFKYKKLQQLLVDIHAEPMPRQEELLRNAFMDWKGALAQVDDVLVIGVRI